MFFSNLPYWSLGFEAQYYLAFGLFHFGPVRFRWVLLVFALVLAKPKIAILFPGWLAGVAAYRLSTSVAVRSSLAILLCLVAGVSTLMTVIVWPDRAYGAFDQLTFDGGRLAVVGLDLGMCLLFALHLLGFAWAVTGKGSRTGQLARSIAWLAGATFTLYLCQQPILQFLVAIGGQQPASMANRLLVYVGTPLLVLLLAALTERRKLLWQALYGRVAVAGATGR